MKSNLKIALT